MSVRSSRWLRGLAPPQLSPSWRALTVDLSWSTIGGLFGAGLLFLTSVIAGRILGPTGFGAATIALVVAQLFTLLASFGLDVAASRVVARESADQERADVVRTSMLLVVPLLLLVTAGSLLAVGLLDLNRFSDSVILVGLLLGAVMSLRTFAERLMASLRRFRLQAAVRSVEGGIALSGLVALALIGFDAYWILPAALLLAAGIAGTSLLVALTRVARRGTYRPARARQLLRYGGIAILHALTPIGFTYGDRIAIGAELGEAQLGVYAAYMTGSYLVMSQLLAIVMNVLFPWIGAMPDKRVAYEHFVRARRLLWLPLFAAMFLVVTAVVLLFGAAYGYDPVPAALAAAWVTLLCFNGVLSVFAITHSERSYLLTALLQAPRSILFVAYLVALSLTDQLSIPTVFAGLIAIELLDVASLEWITRRYVLARPDSR